MNVVIAGGGTGGHLYPCIALAHTFIEHAPKTEILFIGTKLGMEAKVVPAQGFRLETIWAQGVVGKSIPKKIRALILIPIGILQSMLHLVRFSPQLVIGIGGYAAGPVLFAAFLLRMKRVILEPNCIPGVMNQVLAPFVHLAITAFEETAGLLRAKQVACLGVPVRSEIHRAALLEKRSSDGPKTLLVLGGSQGAHTINRAMMAALPFLKDQPIRVIHQTGAKDHAEVSGAYKQYQIDARVTPFIEKMAEVYAVSDLVISRAGAGTVSELAVAGLPSVLIPFPYAKGHQAKNAEPFALRGAAMMILESDLISDKTGVGGERLATTIMALFSNPSQLSEMSEAARRLGHPNAASDIVSVCSQLVTAE
jgi:UDP-N-acetylglucosamine--N-acetylmuramyl-(pentapeptide) pyrophosphoryl-undecaprenol N-acetylglucosamine transferase